jgi:hypothetical protein
MPGNDNLNSRFIRNNTAQQRIAETSFQDDLLSYVIYLTQEQLKPNTENGVTFYYGIVTNIITDSTKNYDRRDIFYSRVDGIERANNTTTKYSSIRNIYCVHIPALHSILFGHETFKEKSELTPEDLFKFRIEDFGKDVKNVQIGNIVKVKFENNSIFTGGVIEQIIDDKTLELKLDKETNQKVLQNFQDYEKCIQDPQLFSQGQGRALFSSVLTNKDVISLGLYDFIEFFVNSFSLEAEKKNISSPTVVTKYNLEVSKITFDAINNYRAQNEFFASVPLGASKNDKYFVSQSDAITAKNLIKLSIDSSSSDILKNYFILFLKNSYGLETTSAGNSSLNIVFNVEAIEEKDFLSYSLSRYETLKQFNIAPATVKFNNEQIKNIETAANNPNNTECDSIITVDLYTDISKSEWKRQNDKILLDHFFDNKAVSSDKKSLKNYDNYQTINSFDIVNMSTFNSSNVVKANPKFYFLAGTKEENGLVFPQGNISLDKVANNLQLLRKDLKKLQKTIAKNESLNDQTVLILPFNWFESKPLSGTPTDRDPNSQHWYGRAVDFVVYIKQNDTIYQIPPEIVYLYVEKYLSPEHQNVGLGLFTSTGYYLHYEILDGIIPKTSQQQKELSQRYWTTNKPGGDELEKMLNSVSPNDFTAKVKEYVTKKYTVQQIGIPNKIRNIL